MTLPPLISSDPAERLHHLWQQFVQAVSPSYEKSRWMDLFLAELLTQLKGKTNIQEILSCCTPGMAVTLLSCELLSDVHQLCQQPGKEEDTQPLQNYLLRGRGARCLLLLNKLGVQGMSCGRELAGLLVSLYPLCLQNPSQSENLEKNEFFVKRQDNDFENIFKMKQPGRGKAWSVSGVHHRLSTGSLNNARFLRKRSTTSEVTQNSMSSESEEEEVDLGVDGDVPSFNPVPLRIQLNPMDFDYFTSVVRSEDEDGYDMYRRRRSSDKTIDPEDFIHDALKPALDTRITVFELCQLLVGLVRELCLAEPCVSIDTGYQTSVQAINFALENLCSLQFGSVCLSSSEEVAELKCSLILLLLTALDRVLQHPEVTATVLHNGLLPVLLRVLEDAVRKGAKIQEVPSLQEASLMQDFIYATLYGIITFIYSLLQQHCSVEKFRDFMDLFRLLADSQGGRLIEHTVSMLLKTPHVDPSISVSRAKKVVNLVGQMVYNLKKVRTEIVHSHQCKRHRHKHCGVESSEKHHHHDLLGHVYSPIVGSHNQSCCIASLFMILVRLIDSGNTEVELRTLRVMAQCGTCCCFPPRAALFPVAELLHRANTKIRATALILLDKILFTELGGLAATSEIGDSCSICSTKVLQRYLFSTDYSMQDSLSNIREEGSTSDMNSASGEDGKNFWSCLEVYKGLLESPDTNLSFAVTDQLFKIIPLTSASVKHELLFKVFYPTFLRQKALYFEDEDETAKFLVLGCLSLLSSQLCNVALAEEFITRGGLDHILELILLPDFSKLCCSILEVTVVIELWKMDTEFGISDELISCLPSLTMLQKALTSSTSALLTSLQRLVIKQQRDSRSGGNNAGTSMDSDSGCLTEHTDSSEQYSEDAESETSIKKTHVQQLASAVVFWRACASLVSCSPQFRTYLPTQEVAVSAHRLLQLVIKQVLRCPGSSTSDEDYSKGSESYLYMRLMEALITVFLGVTPTDGLGDGPSAEEVLSGLRLAVLSLRPRSHLDVQVLCDMLLRCAAMHYFEQQVLPARSKPEMPPLPIALSESLAASQIELEEVEGGSSLDDSYLTADEGYEADVEIPEGVCEMSELPPPSLEDALSPLLVHQNQRGSSCLSQPELCCLVVSLLVQLHEEIPGTFNTSLIHGLQRLASLCRDSPQNCVILAKHGVITTLLSGFSPCLQVRDSQQTELQRVILDLVTLLARYSITPEELALYLNFFKAENPPCDALLSPLLSLASHSKPQPDFILCFPAEASTETRHTPSPGETLAETVVWNLHRRHVEDSVTSAWACSALALPLNTTLGWSMWTHGFSLSLWLRLESNNKELSTVSRSISPRNSTVSVSSCASEWGLLLHGSSRQSLSDSMKSAQSAMGGGLLHLFSVGSESLSLEAWTDPGSELLCLRLCRSDNTFEVVAEAMVESCLPKGQWHHLAVNVRDFMQLKRTVVEVVLIVDGFKEITVPLTFNGLLVRKTRPSCVLVGHAAAPNIRPTCGSWYCGGLMLFRSVVFTKDRAMQLTGLGPNHTNLTDCEAVKHIPNFTSVFGPKTVSCGVNWEAILEGSGGVLKILQDNLLLTYSAQNCNVVHFYPLVVTSPGGAVGSLFPPSQAGFRVVASEQRASQQIPLTLAPISLLGNDAPLKAQQFRGLASAATLLGGINVFLVLFARVVELETPETEQAQALSLLLHLAQSNAELFSQFSGCHKLLLRVLESSRCKAGLHVLKALLDNCCDRALLQNFPSGDLVVSHQCDAIVVNSFLLSTAVRAWRAWGLEETSNNKESGGALGSLFRALHALLRDDHPYREFNAAQLNRVRLVENVLLFCKEKFLYEDKQGDEEGSQIPSAVSCSLVELVRSLMGAPPEFSHVVAVADFLLLLHRASATYVTHARPNFYFLLSPDEPGKQGPYFGLELDRTTVRRPRTELAQPIDPMKLNKALANLHIKQNSGENRDDQEASAEFESLDSNRMEDLKQESSMEECKANSGNMELNGINSLAYSNDSGLSFYPSITEEEEKLLQRNLKEDNWEKFHAESDLKDGEWEGEKANAQSLVVEGLLLLLRDTLLVLPDSMSHQVLNHVVRAEMLLTMANHTDSRVRTAVVRVLSAYLQRSTDEEVNKFLKMKGFYLLASQLSQFEATAELVEACVALVTRCQVSLEEQTELWSLREMSALQVASFPPLLALLPRSVYDTALCHNTVFFLREVITKVPQSYRPLLDCGLLESLGRTLLAVAHLPPDPSDLCGVSEQDLIIGDIYVFFVTIMGRAMNMPGTQNMQVISDVLLQLGYLERQELSRCGWPTRCAQVIRDAQCAVLEGALDRLQERGSSVQQSATKKHSSFLTSMLSSSLEETSSVVAGAVSAQQVLSKAGQLKDVPRGEINERFKLLLQKSVEFLVNVESVNGIYNVSEAEVGFGRTLLVLLLRALGSVLEKQPRLGQRSPWHGAVWAARDSVRVLAGQLLVFLLSPRHPLRQRMFVVHTLHGEPRCRELLTSLLQSQSQVEHKFSVFLRDLLMPDRTSLSGSDQRACEQLLARLHLWVLLSPRPVQPQPDMWQEELLLLHEELDRHRLAWTKQSESAQIRSLLRHEALAKNIADAAMVATRQAVEAQNSERKAFMEHIKAAYSESVQLRQQWHRIVQQMTHERAVWFFPESYPRSWQLDATEGPGRVRNRLQRCHLGVKRKYLMPEYQQKLEALEKSTPLSFLLEPDGHSNSSNSTVLIERLHTNEKICHMTTAEVVTPAHEVPGELLIGETCLYFVSDDSIPDTNLSEETSGSLDVSSTIWHFEDVKEIHQRRFQLQERAVEIFLTNGKTYFVAFESVKERDSFLQALSQCSLPNLQPIDNLSDVVHLWREGLITNFEYLSQLNKMSGRSFNDLMQYPVFPFVLSDYASPRLDLSSATVYRNFEKPMAVQDKKNEQHYINTYNYLKQELQGGVNHVTLNQEPFHYGSHYSNSGTVLHFLVRLPPFTRMFLTYQDHNFDIPDRTFHSLYTTWRLTSSDSTTDVKELIPEFFFLPEFLLNSEGFSFGIRQSGEKVHHVQLPPWCEGDPRRFIMVHRQALESDFVRENLPHWVDLVFGFKQTGKPAVDSINVFHPATYYGFNVENIKDPLERIAWETMVKTYGQTPRQLFRSAHPMVVQSLAVKQSSKVLSGNAPLLGAVQGLRWGCYVGSLAEPEPTVAWRHQHRNPVAGLVPLLTNDVFGLAPCTSLLVSYSKEKGISVLSLPSVLGAALITWGHSDGIVRAKLRKEQPPWPVVKTSGLDPIMLCCSTPDCNQLWVALASGRILVYKHNFQPSKGVLEVQGGAVSLLGHTGPILSLSLCRSFSIAVSGSQDGTAIIWDINTLSYVRSIPSAGAPVQFVAVSEVSGDIAIACPAPSASQSEGSFLRLYTVNAALVGKVACEERITALCFSSAPEGVSINVVAAGLATGGVRLWNTWDLSPVRKITSEYLDAPIISLVYSHDSQHLYASAANGSVVIWEAAGAKGKTPKFLNLTSL